jgi:hypothetical protein
MLFFGTYEASHGNNTEPVQSIVKELQSSFHGELSMCDVGIHDVVLSVLAHFVLSGNQKNQSLTIDCSQ